MILNQEKPPHTSSLLTRALALLLCCAMLSITGCSGCRPETPAEKAAREAAEKAKQEQEEKEKKERERPPFEIARPIPKPSEVGEQAQGLPRVKAGHWMTATQAMKANYEDWVGETQLQVVGKNGRPIGIDRTPFYLASSRPVRLAKGNARQVENVFLVPQQLKGMTAESVLRERAGGSERSRNSTGLLTMKPYEYFFVVLAKEPSRYTYLKTLNAIDSPYRGNNADDVSGDDALYYRVLLPELSNQVPLPENPLCWTTVAYIMWDEVDPEQLDRPRREALVDWLHWGGQLIVNGPDSLKLLEGSFLEPYLPATDGGARRLISEDIAPLNDNWSYGRRAKTLTPTKPWSGITLNLTEGADFVDKTGELFAEKRVGRGRIVVSAMQLAERDLLNWSPHFDNMFNACLMQRPSREFSPAPFAFKPSDYNCNWADKGLKQRRLDASLSTNVRLFARDVHSSRDATNVTTSEVDDTDMFGNPISVVTTLDPEVVGGIGAWNNFNATSTAARAALREAAGVQVPNSTFVISCLAVYLVVLVPLNWAFFRALNKVEYAWIAAPLIALAGTAVVVKQAQLDIGFVRAQTEIALLELQGNHDRGHLSRYTALYTSLATTYNLEYDNETALAAPFPVDTSDPLLPGQSQQLVEISRNTTVKLQGLRVSSAATDMVHSEEMLPLGAGIVVGKASNGLDQVINRMDAPLRSVAIVRRDAKSGDLFGMWVGDIESSASKPFKLDPITIDPKTPLFANERRGEANEKQLNLEPIFQLALDPKFIEPGETRLVGRIDQVLPGLAVSPQAPQIRGAAMIVAHLDYGAIPSPRPDKNTPLDVVAKIEADLESDE